MALAMVGWVKIHRIAVGLHLLGELALGRGVTASRRHAGHLIQEDCWEVPTQEPWEIRIAGLFRCRRWDDLLISKGAFLLNPHCWMVFSCFLGVQAE